jgi:hypothetical protein
MKKPEKDQPKFMTFVEGHPRRDDEPNPLAPMVPYAAPSDVPVPLRQNLKLAHDSGLTVAQLSALYEMPEEWITLFVADEGRAQ